VILSGCLVFGMVIMRDIGFEPRPLIWRSFGAETQKILQAGVHYGWGHKVVRPLFLANLAQGSFFIFGFYSWQRYFLDLLAHEAVWVTGVVTAAFSLAGILGNAIAGELRARRAERAAPLLTWVAVVQTLLVTAIGVLGILWPKNALGVTPFLIAVTAYLVFGVGTGIAQPVRQAFLNRQIPSAQRATVLSVDSFFNDVGGSGGQLGLGWISKTVSIPAAWTISGALLMLAVPMYRRAGRAEDEMTAE